ncbi:aldo/keto reductase [Mycolicibacterium sp. 018/SC-01/001]|uniref:aldo/keto reductase n=1 Tax=Mycolicibacterium sp. 018/SC-01/001 TaxID=2592069 RepID=UPI00117FCE53|nr:aldo/keto reductase [Mycolicibacterium sp. 018/SC-01/001]TRW79864.1 aldo/keto reductase [Mycolicibacterium sp. 018/SC-01/001]
MEYRRLGSSDVTVSEISLGSWLTFAGGVGQDTVRACTEAAFDAGITLFDTAEVYGNGAAESAWGEILSNHARDSYVLATKVWGSLKPPEQGQTGDYIRRAIDASLRRLRTDYVDLYQVHRFDVNVPIEETIEALTSLVTSGKVRYLGFSEWTPQQIRAGIDVAGPGLFVASQPQYSLLWRAPESEVFPLCEANGISQIVWSPLAQGLLTGKYRPGQQYPSDSRFASGDMNVSMHLIANDQTIAAAQRLLPIAEQAGLSMSRMALAWVLRRSEVASAITGASRPEQVRENACSSGVELSADVLAAIDDAVAGVAVTEPTLAVYAQEGVLHR